MSELEIPENDEAVFTEDEDDYYQDDNRQEYRDDREDDDKDYKDKHEEVYKYDEQSHRDNGVTDDSIEDSELYRAVCANIKHTLKQIKSYTKVTLMSDPKASYFTIVDAVLSGPHQINSEDLISVLGVSDVN